MLVGKYTVLAIESLNATGMGKLRRQARSIRDAAISGLLQKVRYKAQWYCTVVVEADRFFPSSKLCADCGVKHDGNENAALNLLSLAINAARELDKLALRPVGPEVTLPDGKALAGGERVVGETGPAEGELLSRRRYHLR